MNEPVYTDKDLYGQSGKPQAADIAQGQLGDCYFIAPLGSIANQQPATIQNAISYNADTQTFTVTLYQPGHSGFLGLHEVAKPVQIEVTQADLQGDKAVGVDGLDTKFNGKGPLWPEVMESAYAKMQAEHKPNETIQDELQHIGNGGRASNTIYALTGQHDQTVSAQALSDTGKAYEQINKALGEGRPMLLNTNPMKDMPTDGLVKGEWSDADPSKRSGHAYMVEGVSKDKDGNVMVTLRNPWGNNQFAAQGVTSNDPTVTVNLKDIIQNGHLQSIDIGPVPGKTPDQTKPTEPDKPQDKPQASQGQTGDVWLDRMVATMNDPGAFSQTLSQLHDSSYGQAFQAQGQAQFSEMQNQQQASQQQAGQQQAQPQAQQQEAPVMTLTR